MEINFRRAPVPAWLAGVLAIAACPGSAGAQPAPAPAPDPDPDPEALDLDGDGDVDAEDRALLEAAEVVVIEERSEGRALAESSRAVTVVDLARARERSSDLGEVLARTHGVRVRRDGGLGADARLSLDGLQGEQIRLFLDGVPLAYAGWGLGVANVPVDLVQRVDVYRGVVPVRLGADALGGAIDLVTDPSWASRASISYQLGSFGIHRVAGGGRVRDPDTGLALGLSLFADRAVNDYPVDVEVADERGRLTPATVRRFHDGYRAGGAIVEAGLVGRGPIERAVARVFHTQHAKELQHNAVMTVPYGEASYAGRGRGLAGELALAGGGWRGRLVAGLAHDRTSFRDVGTGVYDWHGRRIRERRTPGELGEPTDQRITELGLFLRATAERALGPGRVRLAVAPTRSRRRGEDLLDANPAGRDPIEARRELGQLVIGAEHEHVGLGGRLENVAFAKSYHLRSDAEEARPGFVFVPVTASIDRLGAGDSLRLRLSRALALKASYELATRMPSVDELFGDGVLIQENLHLQPETSHNGNLGLRVDHASPRGALAGEVSAFARLADRLVILLGGDRVFSYQNVYAARILGLEGSASWVAPGGWASLDASATVEDVRNASSEGTFGAFEGDRIPNRPWLYGALGGSLRRRGALRAGDELALFASSRYVHAFYRGWESLGRRDTKEIVPAQLVHGAGVTYATRGAWPITTTVELQNLTDARAHDSYGVQRPGRALYVKLAAEL